MITDINWIYIETDGPILDVNSALVGADNGSSIGSRTPLIAICFPLGNNKYNSLGFLYFICRLFQNSPLVGHPIVDGKLFYAVTNDKLTLQPNVNVQIEPHKCHFNLKLFLLFVNFKIR